MKNKRFIWALIALLFLAADLLGYNGSTGEFRRWMRYYGHDVLLPAFLYLLNRVLWHEKPNKRAFVAIWVLFGCFAFELIQIPGWYSGSFDWLDFIAYSGGVALAVVIDCLVFPRRTGAEG